jgi:hypothetical protein
MTGQALVAIANEATMRVLKPMIVVLNTRYDSESELLLTLWCIHLICATSSHAVKYVSSYM